LKEKRSMPFLSLLLGAIFIALSFVAADAQPIESSPAPSPYLYQPEPLEQRVTATEVFGIRTGYLHPFLSVGEFFTDNLFNTPDDRRSEFVTVISPGIWVAVPGSRQPLIDIDTQNTAPGGLEVTRFRTEGDRRFQGYGLYRADIRKHRNFPEEETTNHRAEGLLQANLRGGLTLELLNIFEKNYESYGTGLTQEELNTFESNLMRFSAAYLVSPKLLLEADYGLFTIDFDSPRNRFRERDDNTASAALFYRFLPKTSAVLLYRFADIDYALSDLPSSREHQFLGGFQWNPNERSRARLLMGQGEKKFRDDPDSRSDFIGEAQFNLTFRPRTTFNLRAVRRTHETDIQGTRDVLSHRVRFEVVQRLRERVSAGVELSYVRDQYRDGLFFGGQVQDRKDDYYGAGLNVGFAFRRWLNLSLGYSYVDRQSNDDAFDYRSNNVYLNLTAAI
jgi:polysaccharide biosynthesis protein VpsM